MLSLKLKELRKKKDLSQAEFAMQFKVSNGAVGNWEAGKRQPDLETLQRMAEFFDVSTDYLLGRSEELYAPEITEDYTTFPVIGEVAAGYDHIAVEDWTGETIDIPNRYLRGRKREDFFVVKVIGDSMYPLYIDGDKVLVLRQRTLNYSGQVGVVIYGSEIGTLKKVEFVAGEDWMRLVAINPSVPPIMIEGVDLESCEILGIPKLLVREYE